MVSLPFAQPLVQHQRLGDLPADAHDRIERGHRLLEDYGYVVAADGAQLRLLEPDELAPTEADAAGDNEPRRHGEQAEDRKGAFAIDADGFHHDSPPLTQGP